MEGEFRMFTEDFWTEDQGFYVDSCTSVHKCRINDSSATFMYRTVILPFNTFPLLL